MKENTYFQSIPGMIVPKNVKHEAFHAVVNKFIDKVPDLVNKIEDAHLNKKQENFVRIMESAHLFLENIYARYLESECQILLRRAKYEYAAISAVEVKKFTTALGALSVEIQKAQKSFAENEKTDANEEYVREDLMNNFAAIEKLIKDGKYNIAQSILTYMDERAPEPLLKNFLELANAKKYGEIEKLAEALKEKHLKVINEFARIVSPKKILAVDDRPEILTFISGVLKKHYKIFCATDGHTALKVMEAQKPDLFILDIDMPVMDGYELATRIRASKDHAKTPIIFLAGNSSRDYILKAMNVGGNDFIVKPATGDLLMEKMAKFLK